MQNVHFTLSVTEGGWDSQQYLERLAGSDQRTITASFSTVS